MPFDPDTLLFASTSGRCAYLLIFIISGLRRRSEQYILHWTASIALSMAGILLTSGGHTYPFMSAVRGAIAYSLYGCSIALCWSGVRLFSGRTFSWWSLAVQAILPGGFYGGVAGLGGSPAKALASAFAGLAFIIGRTTWELTVAARQERLPSQFLAAGALGIYFVMFVASVIFFGALADAGPNVDDAYLSLIVDQTCSILIYIGFMTMTGERAAARLERLATTDPLTGLSNRRGVLVLIERTLPALMHRRQPVSVLLADIDRFKAVNDEHGHEGGDLVLTEFACRCRGVLKRRSDHLVARWGGEEFLAVLYDVALPKAAELAEQLRAAIEANTFAIGDTKIAVTVSIGVARLSDAGSLDEAIRNADKALYRAKESGRNRVCVSQQEFPLPPVPARGGAPALEATMPDARHFEGDNT